MFFKREMLPVHEKTMRFRELVNVHLEVCGQALSIPAFEVDETGLLTAGAAPAAFEIGHR